MNFLMGYDLTAIIRDQILKLPNDAWRPARRQDGTVRTGAWVAELVNLDLSRWQARSRVIVAANGHTPARN